jgi:hypothetical protein
MSKRLSFVSGLSALCLWAATIVPANAFIISRTASFLYPCNGINQTVAINLPVPGLPASAPVGIIGASLSLFANPGGVQFVTLSTNDGTGFQSTLAQLGQNTNLTTTVFPGFAENVSTLSAQSAQAVVNTNAGGVAPFQVVGNCTGTAGTPAVQGTVVVWFIF